MRRALGLSYDLASRHLDVSKDVPLAAQSETWRVHLMDNTKQTVQSNLPIELGSKAVINLASNAKMLKYSSILGDQFGNTCSFYYKEVQVEDKLQALEVNHECCFLFRQAKSENTLCNARRHHCLFDTLSLMKSLKHGCSLAAEGKPGLALKRGQNVLKEETPDLKGKEVLGMEGQEVKALGGNDGRSHQYWHLKDFEEETGPGAAGQVSHTTRQNSTI